jgi:cyclomaltodextrin glucanotransferase
MMEKWDTDTPIYRTLGILTQLRRLNPAISLGRQLSQHVARDVYTFTRVYRSSRCFVAINKAETPATLESAVTDLPDRRYVCFLTKRRFVVKEGRIAPMRLAPKQAIVLSHVGPTVRAKTIARAQLNGVSTQPGEVVVVSGDCPELGNWDITKAQPLEYINGNTWFGDIPFDESAGRPVAYKYVIRRMDEHGALVTQPVRENIVCRRWLLAKKGIVKWRDRWEK